MSDEDRAGEWDEDAPTLLENLGAVPELAEDLEPTTPRRALCPRCLRVVKVGGDAARPTFEEMAQNAPDACWASMSGAWRWCSGRRPWQLVLEG